MTKEELLKIIKVAYLWLDNFETLHYTDIRQELEAFKQDVKVILVHEGLIDKNELN